MHKVVAVKSCKLRKMKRLAGISAELANCIGHSIKPYKLYPTTLKGAPMQSSGLAVLFLVRVRNRVESKSIRQAVEIG